ncbi:unnamed protein product [Rhodiola kirilowii]
MILSHHPSRNDSTTQSYLHTHSLALSRSLSSLISHLTVSAFARFSSSSSSDPSYRPSAASPKITVHHSFLHFQDLGGQ